jgi:hypothetical protein
MNLISEFELFKNLCYLKTGTETLDEKREAGGYRVAYMWGTGFVDPHPNIIQLVRWYARVTISP